MQDATPQERFDRRTTQAGLHAEAANHHYEELGAIADLGTGRFRADWHRQMVRYHALRADTAHRAAQDVGTNELQGRYAEHAEDHAKYAMGLADMADGLIDSTEWREALVHVVAFQYDGGGGFEWNVTPAFMDSTEAKIREDSNDFKDLTVWRTVLLVTDPTDKERTNQEIDEELFG